MRAQVKGRERDPSTHRRISFLVRKVRAYNKPQRGDLSTLSSPALAPWGVGSFRDLGRRSPFSYPTAGKMEVPQPSGPQWWQTRNPRLRQPWKAACCHRPGGRVEVKTTTLGSGAGDKWGRRPRRTGLPSMDAGLARATAMATRPRKLSHRRQEFPRSSHLPPEARPSSAQDILPHQPTWYSSKSSQCIWCLKHCPMPAPALSLPAVAAWPQGLRR